MIILSTFALKVFSRHYVLEIYLRQSSEKEHCQQFVYDSQEPHRPRYGPGRLSPAPN